MEEPQSNLYRKRKLRIFSCKLHAIIFEIFRENTSSYIKISDSKKLPARQTLKNLLKSSSLKNMSSTTEDTQIRGIILLDYKMTIGGIQYYAKELQRSFNEDGLEMSKLSHMRSIGDQTYTANRKIIDGEVKDETIETTLAVDEVATFKKNWEDNWNPMMVAMDENHEIFVPVVEYMDILRLAIFSNINQENIENIENKDIT